MLAICTIASALEITKDNAVIVLAANPNRHAQFAAAELQYHLELMLGGKLPVVAEGTANPDKLPIYVGETEFSKSKNLYSKDFQEQEYLVKISNKDILLMGRDGAARNSSRPFDYDSRDTFPEFYEEQGTIYAVYHFLEELLGFRWYLPTEVGIVYDKKEKISLMECIIRRRPFMMMRRCYEGPAFAEDFAGTIVPGEKRKPLNSRDAHLWYLRRRHGGRPLMSSHSFYAWKDIYKDSHPEFFAKGQTIGTHFCYTNPALLAEVVKQGRRYLDNEPEAWRYFYPVKPTFHSATMQILPIVPNDNPYWCKCEACQALLDKSQGRGKGLYSSDSASEYFFTFANAVAKEIKKTHPTALVGVLAYQNYAYPPSFKLEDNLLVTMCLRVRDVFNPTTVENDKRILNDWIATNPGNIKSVWLYYGYPAFHAQLGKYEPFPGYFADFIGEQFKAYVKCNVRGFFYETSSHGERTKNFFLDQLENYMTYKLADMPEKDSSAMIDEFFRRYYGPAEKPMKDFYRKIEEIYSTPANYGATVPQNHNEFTAWSVLGTPQRMKELGLYIEQARKALENAPEIYKRRFELYENGLWKKMLKGAKDFKEKNAKMSGTMQQAFVPFNENPEPGNPVKANWNKAGRLLHWYGSLQGAQNTKNVTAYLTHDRRFLYIMMEDHVDTSKLTNLTNWGDGCEIFMSPQRGEPCWHAAAAHNGDKFFICHSGPAPDARQLTVVPDVSKPDVVRIYVAVPLETIQAKPGNLYYFNILRNQHDKNEACWIPTFGGHYVPQRNGEIYLEE